VKSETKRRGTLKQLGQYLRDRGFPITDGALAKRTMPSRKRRAPVAGKCGGLRKLVPSSLQRCRTPAKRRRDREAALHLSRTAQVAASRLASRGGTTTQLKAVFGWKREQRGGPLHRGGRARTGG
jgi:hypothetical protein